VSELDLSDVIVDHTRWKIRLLRLVEGGDESFAASALAVAHCVFGRWLEGDGARFASRVSYREAIRAHSDFHHCAEEVVEHARRGDKQGAQTAMGGHFAEASSAFTLAVAKLKRDAEKAGSEWRAASR
jgi:methyl-accepting chemotaxis protein